MVHISDVFLSGIKILVSISDSFLGLRCPESLDVRHEGGHTQRCLRGFRPEQLVERYSLPDVGHTDTGHK